MSEVSGEYFLTPSNRLASGREKSDSWLCKEPPNMPTTTTDIKDQQLAEIAARVLGIATLDTQKCDSLDFHDLAVWSIRKALEAAYEAGRRA